MQYGGLRWVESSLIGGGEVMGVSSWSVAIICLALDNSKRKCRKREEGKRNTAQLLRECADAGLEGGSIQSASLKICADG